MGQIDRKDSCTEVEAGVASVKRGSCCREKKQFGVVSLDICAHTDASSPSTQDALALIVRHETHDDTTISRRCAPARRGAEAPRRSGSEAPTASRRPFEAAAASRWRRRRDGRPSNASRFAASVRPEASERAARGQRARGQRPASVRVRAPLGGARSRWHGARRGADKRFALCSERTAGRLTSNIELLRLLTCCFSSISCRNDRQENVERQQGQHQEWWPKKIVKRSKGNKSGKSEEAKNYDEPKYKTLDRLSCLFFASPRDFGSV